LNKGRGKVNERFSWPCDQQRFVVLVSKVPAWVQAKHLGKHSLGSISVLTRIFEILMLKQVFSAGPKIQISAQFGLCLDLARLGSGQLVQNRGELQSWAVFACLIPVEKIFSFLPGWIAPVAKCPVCAPKGFVQADSVWRSKIAPIPSTPSTASRSRLCESTPDAAHSKSMLRARCLPWVPFWLHSFGTHTVMVFGSDGGAGPADLPLPVRGQLGQRQRW
jgi:hypothetical protein